MQSATVLPASKWGERAGTHNASDLQIDLSLNTIVRDSLGAVCRVLAILLTLFAVFNWLTMPAPFGAYFALAGILIGIVAMTIFAARRMISPALAETVAGGLTILMLLKFGAQLIVTGDPLQSTNLVLLVMGAGCFLLSPSWYGIVVAGSGVMWGAAAYVSAHDVAWLHFGLALSAACVIGYLVLTVRLSTYLRLERLRQNNERQKAELERALASSETSFLRLAESAKDVLYRFRYSPGRTFQYLNPGFTDILGYAAADFLADNDLCWKVIHPSDRSVLTGAIPQSPVTKPVVVRWMRKNGGLVWVEEYPAMTYDESGRVLGIEGVGFDVTDRMTAEVGLQQSEERLRLALDASEMGIWDWSVQTNEFTWSGGVERLLGFPEGGFNGGYEAFVAALLPEDQHRLQDVFTQAVDFGTPYYIEYRVAWPDGRVRYLSSKGHVFKDAAGKPRRLIANLQDITERKEFEAALQDAKEKAEESNRVKTSIFANISHEIRTPMTAILGFSEILARRLKGNELEEAARRIHSGGRRLLHLLDSIIDLAKIEVDKIELLPSVHNVDESIRHVSELLSILAEQKGLKLYFDVPMQLKVNTDPRREEQVIMNILGNAIKYTDRGSVTLKTELDPKGPRPMVVIKIIDTGCGISEKFIPHVFEEFRQESEGIARTHEGSGLGLSIVKKLVGKMGGEISITSEKGTGTTVAISFPHVYEPAKMVRHDSNPVPFPEHHLAVEEYAVLYIDDDESCGMLVKDVLSDTHTVVWCDRAEEAIERAVYKRFDVILLDIHLKKGRLDGTQALSRLRDIEGYEKVPIFAVTAYAMKGDRERFEELGFSGYIAKPFDSSQLHEAIARMAKGRPANTSVRHISF